MATSTTLTLRGACTSVTRLLTVVAAVVVVVSSVVGCTSHSVPSSHVAGTTADVPWHKVGPGWVLATWAAGADAATGQRVAAKTLFLVEPSGGRYEIAHFDRDVGITRWFGALGHVLLREADPDTLLDLDLRTGRSVALPPPVEEIAVLRFGTQQRRVPFPTTFAGAGDAILTSPPLYRDDDTVAVVSARRGVAVVSSTGRADQDIAINGSGDCEPERWWSSSAVVAACKDGAWLIPLDHGAPNRLAKSPAFNVWKVGPGLFADYSVADCDALGAVRSDGTVAPYHVPGTEDGRVAPLDSDEGHLILWDIPCDSPPEGLLRYDPTRGTVVHLLGAGANGGFVTGATSYPAPRR